MAGDITNRYDGQVDDSGKVNWRGDQAIVPQGGQSVYKTSDVQLAELGSRKVVGDRVFRYAKAAGTLAPWNCVQTPAANQDSAALGAAAPAGEKAVTITASAAWTKDQKAEGYLYITAGTAARLGEMYRIKSHAAIGSAADGTVYLYDSIKSALAVTEYVNVVENIYKDVVQCTAAAENTPVGFAGIAVASGEYFWMPTFGPCTILGSAGATKGDAIIASATGCIDTVDTTSGEEFQQLGVLLENATATNASLAFITIAP